MSGNCAYLVKKLSTAYAQHCVGCRRPMDTLRTNERHLEIELRTSRYSSVQSRDRLLRRQQNHLEEEGAKIEEPDLPIQPHESLTEEENILKSNILAKRLELSNGKC